MSRSEPKPKVFYKTITDILKPSSPSSSHKFLTQKSRNPLLEVKEPINCLKQSQSLQKVRFIEKRPKSKQEPINCVNLYSQYFNQVDVIFTDLEDYLCQAKDQILGQIRKELQKGADRNSKVRMQEKIDDIKKMSDYIKHISNYLIYNRIPSKRIQTQPTEGKTMKCRKIEKENNVYTESDDSSHNLIKLSMNNSRARANKRGDMITNRQKTIYETILEQSQKKIKNSRKK